jgi:hypothetical protein
MPRGSKPGERRGGRQRATPNKRTVLTDRILAVASANPTASCDAIVAILIKDQQLPADVRVAIARKWFTGARSRSAKGRSATGNAARADGSQARTPLKSGRGAARITSPSTKGASPTASPTTNLLMLPVLLSVVQEEATQPAERRKAGAELALYFLPKKPTQKKSRRGNPVTDQYGFVVDPDVARELRDAKLALARLSKRKLRPHTFAQKATMLQVRIKEIHESLQCPCPSQYSLKDKYDGADVDGAIFRDSVRLGYLGQRRAARQLLTPEEDLEEAICAARRDSFMNGPEVTAKRRLVELRNRERAAREKWGPPLTPTQHAAFRLLTLLYPASPNPERSEIFLADHPFQELLGDSVSSPQPPKRPAATNPQPNPDEDFVEFVSIPRHCRVNANYPQEGERLIWSWWQPRSPRRSV